MLKIDTSKFFAKNKMNNKIRISNIINSMMLISNLDPQNLLYHSIKRCLECAES